jgi:glycosyltransferase involved in cell wall biosynthesis
MRILMCSHAFAPAIGGTETVGRLLAQEFAGAGHEVRVVTETAGEAALPFEVFRKPPPGRLLSLHRWAEVVFHNNISLRAAWPLSLARRRWVVTHQTWFAGPAAALKRAACRFATNIAISPAIQRALPVPSLVIPDPYEAGVFRDLPGTARERELIFVGRLVSDKGCDLLLDALEILHARGVQPNLTIVGDGPERASLEARAMDGVRFAGAVTGSALADLLNAHRILVVPSRWNEPFGVVALEGIACGCAAIGSAGGGLPAAIGPCGRTFPNGDARALAAVIEEMLRADLAPWLRHAEEHLGKHRPEAIAQRYLQVFDEGS